SAWRLPLPSAPPPLSARSDAATSAADSPGSVTPGPPWEPRHPPQPPGRRSHRPPPSAHRPPGPLGLWGVAHPRCACHSARTTPRGRTLAASLGPRGPGRERPTEGFRHEFKTIQHPNGGQHMGGVGALLPAGLEPTRGPTPLQQLVEEALYGTASQQPITECTEHGKVEAGIGEIEAQQVLPVD